MADKNTKGLPDHKARYEHQADGSRNLRHPDGVVQQKVQLTPPGEPTHVPQRKHDEPGYQTNRYLGTDVPAWNPDAPPAGVDEADAEDQTALGLSQKDSREFSDVANSTPAGAKK
jgi:hypothetical protein